AFAGGENRHRHASPAHARAEARPDRYPRGCALNAATQGLVRLPVWRARFVLAGLLAAFWVLGARSLYLQALQTDFLQEKGDARYSRLIEVPATSGRILDLNGDAVAVSTPVNDTGQESIELAHQASLGGKPGSRRVIKDRLGRIVEDVESIREAQDGRDLTLSIDSKIQNLAFGALKTAVAQHHAKAGAII